jgi:hypothetical protein
LVLENNTISATSLGIMLAGADQSLFPQCFHGVGKRKINKKRYSIVSFMIKGTC